MQARAEAVEATRERIARAALDRFITQAYEDVTIAAVAREAGVSHQTLLNHFGSKEGLFTAATEIFGAEIEERRGDAIADDAASLVDLLMDQYEHSGDGNVRLAMLDQRIPAVEEALDGARASHQGWLAEVFADRLPSGRAARKRALFALHAATDVYTWKLLRRDFGLSRRETRNTMIEMAEAILASTERKP